MKTGLPISLVLVKCRRCYRRVDIWIHYVGSSSGWDGQRRCRCDPPPALPEGEELDELVKRAWTAIERDGYRNYIVSAPVKVRK